MFDGSWVNWFAFIIKVKAGQNNYNLSIDMTTYQSIYLYIRQNRIVPF